MPRSLRFLVPGLLLVASACGAGNAPTPVGEPARLEVTNNFSTTVEIYIMGSGISQRIGTVHPGMSGSFTIPPSLVGNSPVEFQARVRSQLYRSGPILLIPGRIVDFEVATPLFNSNVVIRP